MIEIHRIKMLQIYKLEFYQTPLTVQKMNFSIKDFFSKYDQIRSYLQIWSHLLKKSLMENIIFCEVHDEVFCKYN